ncbi:MAG: low molecular weight phosphatase family protein [Pseudomonadota bacterium]
MEPGDKPNSDHESKTLVGNDAPKPLGERTVADPKSVLFVCNHNIIRSPMAEALTRARYGNQMFVASAGVKTGTPDPFVDAVMEEAGIDLHERPPQALADLEDTWFDVIITLSPTAHHVALDMDYVEADEIGYWASADPTVAQGSREQRLDAYRDVRDRLLENIIARFGTID